MGFQAGNSSASGSIACQTGLLETGESKNPILLYSWFESLQSSKKKNQPKQNEKTLHTHKDKSSFCTAVRQMLIGQVLPNQKQQKIH